MMTSLEMRNLILEVLSEENPNKTPWGETFKMHFYEGTLSMLRSMVEHIGIAHGIIDKVVEIPKMAWGVTGGYPKYGNTTNLDEDNLNLFNEEVYLLIYRNILSPGAIKLCGDNLPYLHVTKYGLKCLAKRDVLPYDPDMYMQKISAISSVDEWEAFYIEQSLKCYNAEAFESALIMLGLAGEYLATRLIDKMGDFLIKNEPALQVYYASALQGKTKISQRYVEYENILRKVLKQKNVTTNKTKYPVLESLAPSLDGAAKAIYSTYLRLTRNELAHPSGLKIDRLHCLSMMTSYINYCKTQHKYLEFYISNS